MSTLLTDLEITKVALVDEGSCSEAFIKLAKKKEEDEGGQKPMNFDEILKMLPEDQQEVIKARMTELDQSEVIKSKDAEIETLKTEKAEIEKAAEKKDEMWKEKRDGEEEEKEEDEMMKSLPKNIRDMIEKAKLQERIAQEELMKAKEREADRVALEKAKEFKNIPTDETTLVSVIKSLDGSVKELVLDVLEKANNGFGESEIFKSTGSDSKGDSSVTEDQVWAEIEKAAEPIAVAKSISKQQAITHVIKENPSLYDKYVKARKQ